MELVILTKVEGKVPKKMYLAVHVVSFFPSKAVMTIDCDFVTDGVQCHLLMENYIRLVSVARKFIDFYCCLSH